MPRCRSADCRRPRGPSPGVLRCITPKYTRNLSRSTIDASAPQRRASACRYRGRAAGRARRAARSRCRGRQRGKRARIFPDITITHWEHDMRRTETFYEMIRRQGISRRSFLKFCSLSAASSASRRTSPSSIAHAMETKPRVPVIWLHGLECTCCTESFIRSAHPLAKDVILSMISLDYRRHDHGRGGPPGRRDPRGDPHRVQGPVHPRGRRQPAARRRRRVLHPGRTSPSSASSSE